MARREGEIVRVRDKQLYLREDVAWTDAGHQRLEKKIAEDSTEVRRALWLCFGIAEAGLSCRELQARAARAARAVLAIGRGMPVRERAELLSRCGDVGGCAARLLAYALGRAGTKPDFIES